jgi:prophage antirepressor-like protein
MFVLFCACDVMNVLSVKKIMKIYKKINKKKEKKKALHLDTKSSKGTSLLLLFCISQSQ